MIGHQVMQEHPGVHEITNIVVRRDATCAEEQLARLVPNRERIDREAREWIAADSSDMDRPIYRGRKARLHELPRHVGVHDRQAAAQDDEAEERQRADTDDCDEPTSFHGSEIGRKCDAENQSFKEGIWLTFGVDWQTGATGISAG